jgi:integrase
MAKRSFGTARELPSGRWQVRYSGPDGKRRNAPQTFKNKRDAMRWMTLKEAEIARGEWVDPEAGKVTLAEWGRRWLDAVSPSLKPKTRASYESVFRTLIKPRFGKVAVNQIRPISVSEWVASMTKQGLSASRIRQAYRVVSQIMTTAVHNDLIKVSPCRGVKLPRMPQTEPHILTVVEVERLVSAAREPHDLLIQLLAYGGLRIGEAFALRRAHVDLGNARLFIAEAVEEIDGKHVFGTPKSHQCREIKLPAFVIEELKTRLGKVGKHSDALLFVGRTGKPLHYNSWRRWYFDPAVKAARLDDVTPHDLRATHATWVADRHGVMAAARRLGHSNASVTTRHYARVVEGRDEEIATALDDERKSNGARAEEAGDAGARTGHDEDDEDPPPLPCAV